MNKSDNLLLAFCVLLFLELSLEEQKTLIVLFDLLEALPDNTSARAR